MPYGLKKMVNSILANLNIFFFVVALSVSVMATRLSISLSRISLSPSILSIFSFSSVLIVLSNTFNPFIESLSPLMISLMMLWYKFSHLYGSALNRYDAGLSLFAFSNRLASSFSHCSDFQKSYKGEAFPIALASFNAVDFT